MRLTRFDETRRYNDYRRSVYVECLSRAVQLPSPEPLRAGAPSVLVIAALLNNPPLDYFF
jgi:hypothetical protein